MKYLTTRGGITGASFEQALFSGYAPDGGLYFPEVIPQLSEETLQQWSTLSYPELVRQLLPHFISEDEIPIQELDAIIGRAFCRFDTKAIVELTRLQQDLNVLELWHGPTLAFKDLALSCVGQFVEYFLNKRKEHVTILVGTSGDTGSAAIESVRGLKWADIIVLLPKDRCSHIQELQMTTVIEDNVHVFRVDGGSDVLDIPIKSVFMDTEFVQTHKLLSINSINWARILVQTAHYFYAYFQMCPGRDECVEIVVPTGACGNITSGLIAQSMGLNINLVTAVNVNDIVARAVTNGDFSVTSDVKPTLASAMDIQVPYNFERLLHMMTGGDTQQIARLMSDVEDNQGITVPKDIHIKLQKHLSSFVVDDAGIKATMAKCWTANNYMLCPHTAVAAKYHYDNKTSKKRICLATASAEKFQEAVAASGCPIQPNAALKSLDDMPTRYTDMANGEDWEAILRSAITRITDHHAS